MNKHKARILIIDDDPAILTSARLFLKQKFEYVWALKNPDQFDQAMTESAFDVVLLDMNYKSGDDSGKEGLTLIQKIVRQYPQTEVIPITAHGEINIAVEALKQGARDFITKPWRNDKLLESINNALTLNSKFESKPTPSDPTQEEQLEITCKSKTFTSVIDTTKKVAPTDASILIIGESGSGKEEVADYIQRRSHRAEKPYIKVDLSAIPDNLFESEIFGHVKGAFTDAKTDRVGKLEAAHQGTILFDEIGNIDLAKQAKLLSTLQNLEVTPLGSNKPRKIDVRVICATNSNLNQAVQEGQFRQDFLYRINTVEIPVPPLRERIEDIEPITRYYFNTFKEKYNKPNLKITQETLARLREYPWPGNIRELIHTIERTVILSNHNILSPADLKLESLFEDNIAENLNIEEMEKAMILKSLKKNRGNITHAARDLGIDRQALYRRLEKYDL
ncbi:MAG: sigma-54-dependent Fis family transcriptional regulator [Cyclobacteriaceae bacterium]